LSCALIKACRPRSFGRAPLLRFLIPLQRSLAALALSGAASLRTIPLRRFHPASRRPARLLFKATCRPGWFRSRPCGFPLERIPCDEARVADALRSGRSSRIRRSRGA
jgi:hypothetical protein